MIDATPTKPFCYGNGDLFDIVKPVCCKCAFLLVCTVLVEGAACVAGYPRKAFVEAIVRANIPRDDAIAAIQKAYDVTHNAARKQYDRWREKLGHPQ